MMRNCEAVSDLMQAMEEELKRIPDMKERIALKQRARRSAKLNARKGAVPENVPSGVKLVDWLSYDYVMKWMQIREMQMKNAMKKEDAKQN